jgi:hypothetical protein
MDESAAEVHMNCAGHRSKMETLSHFGDESSTKVFEDESFIKAVGNEWKKPRLLQRQRKLPKVRATYSANLSMVENLAKGRVPFFPLLKNWYTICLSLLKRMILILNARGQNLPITVLRWSLYEKRTLPA